MMIPIFDTCVVTATRKLSGRPISRGGRDHTSHRLVALGMSERQAVMLLYAFAIISGALALMVRLLNTHVLLLLVPSFALASLFVGLYLGKVRVYEQGQPPPGNTIINVLAKFSYKRRLLEIVLDAVLVVLADYAAYLLRFDGNPPSDQLVIFGRTLPLMIAIQMLFFLLGGIYGGLWRYVGVNDLIVIARSVLAGTVVSWGITHVVHGFHGPLGAVFVLDALLLLVFVSASRVSFRLLRALVVSLAKARPDAMPVLIYGAGDHGELLIREILNNPDYHYVPVGFVDDDGRKAGYLIHGYRIFHSRELPGLIRTHHIGEVLISTDEVP
jgi:UDP-GlcNAc:undecaprenyl-phosphate GlcNAc-1-phosphate transferase